MSVEQLAVADIVRRQAERGKAASRETALLPTERKNAALRAMAAALRAQADAILAANAEDMRRAREAGMASHLLDRLALTPKRLDDMAMMVEAVAELPDPVGEVIARDTRPNGLRVERVRVPIGLIAVVYEARPNVTSDVAALCLKSGNAVLLRGGSDAYQSSRAIVAALRAAIAEYVNPDAIQLVETTDRQGVLALLTLNGLVDLAIPRGGADLITTVVRTATVPTIETGVGNCHVYVERSADPEMALAIVLNAKCSRPSVCNAAETLLIDRAIAPTLLPRLGAALRERGVELRVDPAARAILGYGTPATEADWATEYLDLILAVRVVDGLDEALAHIARYGSQHSEAIVTRDAAAAERFLHEVDAAAVYWNASTRFTDGYEMGLGAEIGISTQKMHARGPMGLRELCTYKWVIRGDGQVR
ncbi:MAG TPA: glutamate-5-semialdehyde dehydrogenase [Chloroflexota bacterium]|jgi:glutamate-5-semialdehyde dehydrogenase|nr:glutamate-5-semialdehyde dehydrogenase [Chloroflexota bacterium]